MTSSITVFPNGDGTNTGTWTPSTGSTYYNLIDETPEDDGDFVSGTAQNSYIFFQFEDMPTNFGAATAVEIYTRSKTGTKGDYLNWGNLQLFANNESSALTSATAMNNGNLTFTDFTYNPSITGSTDKTTWDGLRLKLNTATGTTSSCQISAASITVTYTALYNEIASGGALGGATSQINEIVNPIISGGVIFGSNSNVLKNSNLITTGGSVGGGATRIVSEVESIYSTGGVVSTGNIQMSGTTNLRGSGGVIGEGYAFIQNPFENFTFYQFECHKASSLKIIALRQNNKSSSMYYDRTNPLDRI